MRKLLCAIVAAITADGIAGQCGWPTPGSGVTNNVSQINFAVRGGGSIDAAIGIWRDGCWSMGDAYPSLSRSSDFVYGPGIVNFNLFFSGGTSGNGRCGKADVIYGTDGSLQGGNIFNYEYEILNEQPVPCASLPNYNS